MFYPQEEWLPIGHRFRTEFSPGSENQAFTRFVRDREWCAVAITNSLCVKRVRESRRVNTTENPRPVRAAAGRNWRPDNHRDWFHGFNELRDDGVGLPPRARGVPQGHHLHQRSERGRRPAKERGIGPPRQPVTPAGAIVYLSVWEHHALPWCSRAAAASVPSRWECCKRSSSAASLPTWWWAPRWVLSTAPTSRVGRTARAWRASPRSGATCAAVTSSRSVSSAASLASSAGARTCSLR